MPTLLPPVYPRFSLFRMTVTAGNVVSILMASSPSEPLSTTTTRLFLYPRRLKDLRHSVVSARPFQFRTRMKTSGCFPGTVVSPMSGALLYSGTTPLTSGAASVRAPAAASATPVPRQDELVETLDFLAACSTLDFTRRSLAARRISFPQTNVFYVVWM